MLLKTFLKNMPNSLYMKTKDAGFKEEEHPREGDGKFTEKGNSSKLSRKTSSYLLSVSKELDRIKGQGAIIKKIMKESPLEIEVSNKEFGADLGMMKPLGDDKYKILVSEKCFKEGGSENLADDILRHEFGHYLLVNFSNGTKEEERIFNQVKEIYLKYKDSKQYPKDMMSNYTEFFSESFSRMLSKNEKENETVPGDMKNLINKILKG